MNKSVRLVGTNYHPHDWTQEQWVRDLDSMRAAGFHMIRTAHICWDSLEPHENIFTFEWLDQIMELCRERGLKVFLDIPGRSAPLWLHKKFPSIDIVDESGNRLDANRRYMEDVGDPHFREYALRLTMTMVKRYADHPALLGFGLENELGSGYHSYSPTALARFQDWLKKKYNTIDNLNRHWNTKRWSRKLERFSDVFFPVSGPKIKGAPEPWLDMKRFFSDEILEYLEKMYDCCKAYAPNVPLSTNHWAENPQEGYDYQKNYRKITDFAGEGFYPGINPEYEDGFLSACMMTDFRMGEMDTSMWCLEFQTGTNGGYACPPGIMRFYAYLAWIYRCDIVCAWTWRTMLGGEEQYFYGLLDHDGHHSRKLDEFRQIAGEWRMLEEKKVYRRDDLPRIGIAYSRDSYMVQMYNRNYYKMDYTEQIQEAYKALFHNNIEVNFLDLRKVDKDYSIVIIPGHALMEKKCADTIRSMVKNGTTVIMTAYSAKVDEYNQAFQEPLPGYLSDVFGIAVRGFDRNVTHVSTVNEGGMEKRPVIKARKQLDIKIGEDMLDIAIDYHEFLEPGTARPLAYYTGIETENTAAVTCNSYGKGRAVYCGIPANEILLWKLITHFDEKGCYIRPDVPPGIVTRELQENRQIFVNTTDHEMEFQLSGKGYGIFSRSDYDAVLLLEPYGTEIIEFK